MLHSKTDAELVATVVSATRIAADAQAELDTRKSIAVSAQIDAAELFCVTTPIDSMTCRTHGGGKFISLTTIERAAPHTNGRSATIDLAVGSRDYRLLIAWLQDKLEQADVNG